MTGIYKITSPTGRVYIGQSYNIHKRFNHYKRLDCRGQTKIYNSLIKHGVLNHSFDIIIQLDNNIGAIELTKHEQYYIDYYKSIGVSLLNLKDAGVNGKLSIETRQKMSAQRIGNKSNTGRNLTEEHKKNISIAGKGRVFSESHKAKLKESRKRQVMKKGFVMSDEAKINMSNGKKLWWKNKKQQQ